MAISPITFALIVALILTLILVMSMLALARWQYARVTAWTLAAARRAAGLRRRSVATPGFRIVYLEGGAGEPLVLLHGIGADKDNFLLVARALSRHFRVIIPDLPGFGESDQPDASYALGDQVERLHSFFEALGVTHLHLGGNSMGGLIAGAYAAAHADRVRSLWLLAPAGVKAARASELMQAIEAGGPLPILAQSVDEVRRLLAFVMHRPPPMPTFMLRTLAERQASAHSLNQHIVSQLVQGPWLDQLLHPDNAPPTLIVWGDCDRALDCSGAEVLQRLMPEAHAIILRKIGHVPMIEAPRRIVRDYLKFHNTLRTA
jgi:abhydrolase domain-containing protein 6